MKNFQSLYRLLLVKIFILFTFFALQACELPYFQINNCLKSQSWATWNSDYTALKEICAGLPIDIKVFCSKGSLPYGDEVCVYEIVGGIETLLFCEDASTFSFTPEEGKSYRIETLSGGSQSFTVSFVAVNCLDFEVVQNNDCDAIYEHKPISFSIPGFNSPCYYLDWDFGDGTQIEYGSDQTSHEYDLVFNDPCQTCQTFTVTITLNNELCGENCPELTFEKEVTVCRETNFYTGFADDYVIQCYNNPCLELGDYSNLVFNIPPCYYDGFSFEWTIVDFYGVAQPSIPELHTTVCPAVEGTYTLTMTDPWGCTFSKTLYVYNSSPPDTTIIEHILCSLDQEMLLDSPVDCQNIEYDPPYIMLPPYTSPAIIRCYDDQGCLNKVYIHQPVYEIQEACMDDIDDICEGDELIVNGSCSQSHLRHRWEIYEMNGGSETLLWTKEYKEIKIFGIKIPKMAGVKNLSNESGICFVAGKCYKIKLGIGYECEGDIHWNTTEKEFCVNPKPPCFGGPDITLDPCVTDCVTIGLNGYSDVIPYPYPNLTHVWEDGTQGIYRTVCPTVTTTYYLTTTNQYGCVCIDEVTVTVIEHDVISNTEFPVCFSNNNPYGLGAECILEVCLDIQINTGSSCECPYSVTRLCQVIPFGEIFCFNLEQLDLPIGENYCATVLGSTYTLGGNIATVFGSEYPNVTYFNGSECPCNMYTHLLFEIQPDGTILLIPTFTVGGMISGQNDPVGITNQEFEMEDQFEMIEKRDQKELKNEISIFPNPVQSVLTINMPENIVGIQLFSVNGELAFKKDCSKEDMKTHAINVSDFVNGLYLLKVSTLNKTESRSIIINH